MKLYRPYNVGDRVIYYTGDAYRVTKVNSYSDEIWVTRRYDLTSVAKPVHVMNHVNPSMICSYTWYNRLDFWIDKQFGLIQDFLTKAGKSNAFFTFVAIAASLPYMAILVILWFVVKFVQAFCVPSNENKF